MSLLTIFIVGCICTHKQYNLDDNKKISKACRIGITTRPNKRLKEWENFYKKQGKKVISWTILSKHLLKSSAQKGEIKEAKKQNCVSHQGGPNPKISLWRQLISPRRWWVVYKLEYEN